jgi:hypothetical protein
VAVDDRPARLDVKAAADRPSASPRHQARTRGQTPAAAANTAVVLLHDGGRDRGTTVGALKRIIDDIRTGRTSRLVKVCPEEPA